MLRQGKSRREISPATASVSQSERSSRYKSESSVYGEMRTGSTWTPAGKTTVEIGWRLSSMKRTSADGTVQRASFCKKTETIYVDGKFFEETEFEHVEVPRPTYSYDALKPRRDAHDTYSNFGSDRAPGAERARVDGRNVEYLPALPEHRVVPRGHAGFSRPSPSASSHSRSDTTVTSYGHHGGRSSFPHAQTFRGDNTRRSSVKPRGADLTTDDHVKKFLENRDRYKGARSSRG